MSAPSDALVSETHHDTAELDDVELDRAMSAVSPEPSQQSLHEPSRSSRQQPQPEAHIALPMEDDQLQDPTRDTRSSLPFGAHAPLAAATDSTASASSSSSSAAAPASVPRLPDGRPHTHSTDAILRAQHIGRTPPPPYPEYQVLGQSKAVGFVGKTFWAGLKVFGALEFVGEVFADFFGLYDSKYQYVVDAHDRHRRELESERAERLALRREALADQAAAAEQADPAQVRTERNREEERARGSRKVDGESKSQEEPQQNDQQQSV